MVRLELWTAKVSHDSYAKITTCVNFIWQHWYKHHHDPVFNPRLGGYNGAVGKFEASINMGPVLPPQRKGRLPHYSRDKIEILQQKCDELEELGVLRKPENVDITVEYVNPSFHGGYRIVSAFEDVGRYSKLQPSLMPDIESVLRSIDKWKYIITSDLTCAFH